MSSSLPSSQDTTSKANTVRNMFASVSKGYDLANSVLSLGIHHLWRQDLVSWSQVEAGQKVLDCATGTGDLAIAFAKRVVPNGQVEATDFCAEMLSFAPKKSADLPIRYSMADATELPFENNSFDVVSMAFGIRNIPNRAQALREMVRVAKTGGRVMILEFGQPTWTAFRALFGWYSKHVLPKLGGLITGKTDAYVYLEQSSAAFPSGESFVKEISVTVPTCEVQCKPLAGGIAWMYRLTKNA